MAGSELGSARVASIATFCGSGEAHAGTRLPSAGTASWIGGKSMSAATLHSSEVD